MSNTTIIIAGMHRSGTSLITQWLNKCGLYVGEDMLGANPSNLDGHFEDLDFLNLHEDILRANKVADTGLITYEKPEVSGYYIEKLKKLINCKNREHKVWGWKDPRTCLFLDTYNKLIPNALYLVVVRDYKSVVSSLLSRDFRDYEQKYLKRNAFQRFIWKTFRRQRNLNKYYRERADHYMKVHIHYNEEILRYIESLPANKYIVLNYTQLKTNAEDICTMLNNRWHLALNYFDFKQIYKEKLISKHVDTDKYIIDRSLISKTKVLQKLLENYMMSFVAMQDKKQPVSEQTRQSFQRHPSRSLYQNSSVFNGLSR